MLSQRHLEWGSCCAWPAMRSSLCGALLLGVLRDCLFVTTIALRTPEQFDQLAVGGRKGERPEIRTPYPTHLLAQHGTRFTRQCAAEEVERHRALRVMVCGRQQQLVDVDGRIELFTNLPTQRLVMPFGRVHLASGKLPHPFEMRAPQSPGNQDAVARLDDGGDDNDRLIRGRRGWRGCVRQACWE